jgi:hypothetical protein
VVLDVFEPIRALASFALEREQRIPPFVLVGVECLLEIASSIQSLGESDRISERQRRS